jgi:hypothetical protein
MDSAAQARYDLITNNLAEVLDPEIIQKVLAEGRNPRIYWGTGMFIDAAIADHCIAIPITGLEIAHTGIKR